MSCFSRPRPICCSQKKYLGIERHGLSTIHSNKELDCTISTTSQNGQMVVVFWTGDWLVLDAEAQLQVKHLALRNPDVIFVRCCVDDLADKARAFAVHDLPAFHIFDGYSLVERLHGLSSIASIEDVLQHFTDLKQTDSNTSSPSSSLQMSWVDHSLAGSLSNSPLCNSAASTASTSTSHRSCDGSYDRTPMSTIQCTTPGPGSNQLQTSQSTLSNVSVHTERSYLPQYTRTKFQTPQISRTESARKHTGRTPTGIAAS